MQGNSDQFSSEPNKRSTKIDRGFRSSEEMMSTILEQDRKTVLALLRTRRQPRWYPPIPSNKDKKESNHEDDFLTHGFNITSTPLEENDYNATIGQLIDIDPTLLGNLTLYGNEIDVITGFEEHERYSYPIISKRVGYLVTMLVKEDESRELVTVSVYNNPIAARTLLDFLSDIEVTNMVDLNRVKKYLEKLFPITE